MSIKHRILATVAAGTMVAGMGLAAAPAGADPLPIGIPTPCTHGCDGGGGHGGPDDLANPTQNPDPGDPGTGGTDVPIPADATFTG